MSNDAPRANWNPIYEKGLVNILLEYKVNSRIKTQNGWTTEGWRMIAAKFNENHPLAPEPDKWAALIENNSKLAKYRSKPFPLYYSLEALHGGSVATGDLNFTSNEQLPSSSILAPPTALAPSAAFTAPSVLPDRTTSEQSIIPIRTNPFALDGQETTSALNEPVDVQSVPSNDEPRQEGNGSGRKCNQSHIGAALEGYVEYKKSQSSKTLEAFEEQRKRDEEFSIGKCVAALEAIVELTKEEKSYALELFESSINREVFVKTTDPEV
ncbi:hypothetical protein BS78_05G096300 [Paspalum vaginatum]|nr:hypothetical protein BS78_05G096300 [Paspalum vaginatum]